MRDHVVNHRGEAVVALCLAVDAEPMLWLQEEQLACALPAPAIEALRCRQPGLSGRHSVTLRIVGEPFRQHDRLILEGCEQPLDVGLNDV